MSAPKITREAFLASVSTTAAVSFLSATGEAWGQAAQERNDFMSDADNQVEQWEFGSLEWVQYASKLGVSLFEDSELDLSKYEWGFSEEYTNIPERLLAGRDTAGYHLMIHDGKVSGGTTLPDECLALPGFHVSVEWALIAHSSYFPFNVEGRQQRAADQAALRVDLRAAVQGRSLRRVPGNPRTAEKGEPHCPACQSPDHERAECPVWPPGIGEVLAENKDKARRLKRSPELEGFPETVWGVPIFSKMTDEQKARFIKLLG